MYNEAGKGDDPRHPRPKPKPRRGRKIFMACKNCGKVFDISGKCPKCGKE